MEFRDDKYDEKIKEFIIANKQLPAEEIKKVLRKKFKKQSFYQEDVENYIIQACKDKREKDGTQR